MIELFDQLFRLAFGLAIAVGLFAFIHKRHAEEWGKLVAVYGRDWRTPQMEMRFANMVLYAEKKPVRTYKGIIGIGLHEDGIALRPNRFLVLFQPPIFVPYKDISGWKQHWYVDAKSTELSFRQAPEIRVIMPRKQVDWMLSLDAGSSVGATRISEATPPHGDRPWLSLWIYFFLAVLFMATIAGLLHYGLPDAG